MIAAIYPDEPMTWRGWGKYEGDNRSLGCGSSESRRAGSAFLEADEEEKLLAAAGEPLRTIQELGGWASLEIVERYTHLSPTHKADAVERIAQNSPTLFTTAPKPRRLVTRKPAESQVAPVAQVDRAAVS